MTSILDRYRKSLTGFIPRNATELLALRLAHKLGDARAAAHYVMIASAHRETRILNAYRRTIQNAEPPNLGRRFHVELPKASDRGSEGAMNLLAVRVERRCIAAAVFSGRHLEYTQTRQLSSDKEKALASAVGFVDWLISSFPIESAALEALSNGHEFQRQLLTDAIAALMRSRMVSIWQVPKTEIFQAWAYPAFKSRKQLREAVAAMWPILAGSNGKTFIRDAAALGLYVQIERLFIIN